MAGSIRKTEGGMWVHSLLCSPPPLLSCLVSRSPRRLDGQKTRESDCTYAAG